MIFLRQESKRLLAVAIGLAMASSVPAIGWAQSSDATIRGQGPADVDVVAKNTATGATRRTHTDKAGSYALVGLPPGTYQVDAGPGTARTVTVTVASVFTLNLSAQQAAAATSAEANAQNLGGVTVSATTLQEVKTSEVGTLVSMRQIETTPAASRNFLEFADTVPGMVFTRDANGNTSLRSGAQASSNINVYIDGVGQKNYVLPGGTTGQNNSQGNPFPQLAVAEYKVITSNYKAEYDQLSSAAITAETKSGTNQFHGDVFGSFTNGPMRAKTPSEEATGKKVDSHEKDYGFDFGGPLLKDKAHFYIAYEGKEFDSPITVVPAGNSAYWPNLPQNVKNELGPASLPFKENNWFGKVDWEPTDRDRIEVSGKYRDETAITGIGEQQTANTALNTHNTDKRFDIRWDHSTDSWFNRLQATYEDAYYTPTPINTGVGAQYTAYNNQNQPLIVDGASPLSFQNKGQKGPAISDDFTLNDVQWHGDHVIKMGVKFKSVKLTAQDAGDTNALATYAVGPDGTESIPYKIQFGAPVPGQSPVATSRDRQFGTYIQDDWQVDDHWTFNIGVRWDYEETPSYLNYVTPASVIAAINSQDPNAPTGQTYAQTLAKGGVNINNYISTGNNRKAQKNEIQPRLGFSNDLFGDEEHVIFGGWGRSYDRNLYESLQIEQTKSVLSQPTINFNTPLVPCAAGPTCLAWNPAYLSIPALQALVANSTAGKEVDMINNNLKAPYSDQLSIGMRNKIGDWNTSIAFVNIKSHDGIVYTLGNRYPNGSFWQNGSQPWSFGIPGYGSLIIGNNGLKTKTNQLLLSVEKPYTDDSHWSASFAYTYTNAVQNNDNQDPTDQYAFDYATIGKYPFTDAALAKHRFVATGSLDGPWGFVFGSKLTLATPIPSLGLQCGWATPTGVDNGTVNGGGCLNFSIQPPGTGRFLVGGKVFGYRDLDLQATKNFKIWGNFNGYVRIDLLNAFNWNNYVDYIQTIGTNGQVNRRQVIYNPTGDITGYPRTLKVTAGINF
ncbi:TonB-dependent receptor [Dyella sp.]|uniref:TonB-dependent receptor n=1 Tax=Dyella sp. TaxID=1869338 RepID=UPI00284D88B9|nr:TonB-dependent receptor [Dyella sp.]MDR3447631.1 TonB-dependent receptor [Dyella sp.]